MDGPDMGVFSKIFCLTGCFLVGSLLSTSAPCMAEDLGFCPQSNNPAYSETIKFYSYRLKDAVARHGCDAIAVYHAFGDESGTILDFAEEDDNLMSSLVDALRGRDRLVAALAANRTLTQALGNLLLDESHRDDFLEWLKNLNSSSLRALGEKNPAVIALSILIPNVDPRSISKGLSAKETDTLLNLVDLCAVTAAAGEATGMGNLMPYLTTNPNDALAVYKDVIKAWGNGNLSRAILKTPGSISAVVPPLEMGEMRGVVQTPFTARQFHDMQKVYINIMRDVYLAARNKYSAAWAGEICSGFAESLSLALLTATPEQASRIRKFLLAFVDNGKLFRKLFMPSGCSPENNLALLGRTINMAGFLASKPGDRTAPLTALAGWHADGRLGVMLENWLPLTTPEKLNVSLHNYLEGTSTGDTGADAVFIEDMIRLALLRDSLDDGQRKIFDELCARLCGQVDHPAKALAFLHEVGRSLFDVLRPGRFNHPVDVAMHLVAYGYPESNNPTLFEYFIEGDRQGFMPMAGEAIRERGSMPENELLEHGRTFADRHGGYTVGDMVDAADTAITVGGAIVATIGTAGAAAPAVGAAITRVGAKQAARQIAKRMIRNIGKSALKVRQVAMRPGTYIRKEMAKVVKKPGQTLKKAVGTIGDGIDAWDEIQQTRKIFAVLAGGAALSLWADPANSAEREYICPRDPEEKEAAQ